MTMKIVKNAQGEVIAFGGHEGYEPVVPEGCTLEEVEGYEPTVNPQNALNSIKTALQAAIDAKARSLDFSSGRDFIGYAGFPNLYQQQALIFADWEVSVWVEAGAYRDQVIAGTQPMPTPEEAVAMMPVYSA